MTTSNPITMAADLYRARDAAKSLLGDRYKPLVATVSTALLTACDGKSEDILQAAIAACKVCKLDGMDAIITLAAAVETLEPSE